MAELIFEVTQETDGGYYAVCLTLDIFTPDDTWDDLRSNVREAVRAYFFDQAIPERVRLHIVREEVFAPLGRHPAAWLARNWRIAMFNFRHRKHQSRAENRSVKPSRDQRRLVAV